LDAQESSKIPTLVIAVTSGVLLLTARINSAWLIFAAGVFGWRYR
jgi:chromate transport protein ChrA